MALRKCNRDYSEKHGNRERRANVTEGVVAHRFSCSRGLGDYTGSLAAERVPEMSAVGQSGPKLTPLIELSLTAACLMLV